MSEPGKPSEPEEQPVVVGADDVDRLLAEAQSLADQIAAGSGTTGDAAGSPSPAASTSVEDKDALGATEEVEKTLAELEAMLGVGSKAEPSADGTGAGEKAAVAKSTEAQSQAPDTKAATHGKNQILDLPPDAAFSGEVDVALRAGAPDRVAGGAQAGPNTSSDAGQTRSFGKLLGEVKSFALRTGAAVKKLVPQTLSGIAAVIDRPFAGLSPVTKQYIGYAAIITVLAAIASFTMPPLFERNPYLEIGAPAKAPAEAAAPAHE
ncbi:MAG TPA: hypothetical protein VMV94_14985 [Phycisphaerae bacterium]|nr:hypothetical protein [Phycisphaerae bacterium]